MSKLILKAYIIISIHSIISKILIIKTSSLRLAKRQNAEITYVNEQFCCKRNEKISVFLQTLHISFWRHY